MNIEISKIRREAHFHMPESHFHEYYELYYLISGKCRMFVNHTIYDLVPGNLLLIAPGEIHRVIYNSEHYAERFAVLFSLQEIEDMKKSCQKDSFSTILNGHLFQISTFHRSRMETYFEQMLSEQEQPDDFSCLQNKCSLSQLFIFLARIQYEKADHLSEHPQSSLLDSTEEAIQTAALYLYEHHSETLTLEDAANIAHMSPSYFSRTFKKSTGFGFKEYLTSVRIQEASTLLTTSSISITEIALQCGFPDGNYFGDVFRKIKGCSPLQFRKMHSSPYSK